MTDAAGKSRLIEQFTYRQAQRGAYIRYVNVILMALFVSRIPMPLNKNLLSCLCALDLVANGVYHIYIALTRRWIAATYTMATIEICTMFAGIYLSGYVMSPFFILLPLVYFTIYFAEFNERVTIIFGLASLAVFVVLFGVWLTHGPALPAWNPVEYRVFASLLLTLELFGLGAFLYLSVQTNPFLIELSRQERVITDQQKRAELGTALAMITHEIRTPLTSAVMSVDQATHGANRLAVHQRVAVERHLHAVRLDLHRVETMLESVLSFARDKRGRIRAVRQPLRPLIERALNFLTLKHGRHLAHIETVFTCPRDQRVRCDRDAMHQILVNIFDNAIQHRSPKRRLRLEFGAAQRPGRTAVTVRDNGRGIPPARLAGVFERFVSNREGGTGLGLAIVRQLVGDHGGEVEVQSAVGAGTTFTLLFPAGR